jgi:hypothetical protein
MERLNVHADKNAIIGLNSEMASQANPVKRISLIPSSKVALRIHHTDITSHLATHLHKAATRPAMMKRAQTRYGWTESQFDMVDWKAHQGALQKLAFKEKKFVLKFIHQSLPMGEFFNKIDPSQSLLCSSCKSHQESHTHLYRCPARRAAMEDIFLDQTLGQWLQDNHTCPKLAWSLLEALFCEVHRSRYPVFKKRHGAQDPKFRKLHQLQAYIGWPQLFQGRLVSNWSRLQEEFLEEHSAEMKLDRRHFTGDIWVRKLVNILWKTARMQWDHRNADCHSRTTEESQSI